MIKTVGTLNILPVLDNLTLVAEPTATQITSLPNLAAEVGVVEIDPGFSDTAAFCDHYKVSLSQTVNCVVVKATRGDKSWYAACLVFGNARADVNGVIRRHLDARNASFAPMDEAVSLTRMEYGGITPVGLPADWPILIDKAVAEAGKVIIGSGIRKSKLIVTGNVLAQLPHALVLEGVAKQNNES